MSGLDPAVVSAIETKARTLYQQDLASIAQRFEFEGAPSESETTGLPMVLFLGNHSSRKSSFINYLVGEDLQRTGIAPVDDGFTIISHSETSEDKDGQAVVTNPLFSWGDLERFGPQLVTHLRLRLRNQKSLEGIALVDSPGMIDAADASVDRGYDFPGVVRWFAERADVILFLFDPDKPGTTGETLKVLTDALAGLDHKLLLIFNKVDRFHTMRDFARAYGALCWNLSKAIPRKDLPHVFNTYLPVPDSQLPHARELPLEGFENQRQEVKAEVARAPHRRLDNVISRLYQYARRLRVHAVVLGQLSSERLQTLMKYVALLAGILIVAGLALWAVLEFAGPEHKWKFSAWILIGMVVAGLITYGVYHFDRKLRDKNISLEALFERAYSRELTLGDEADDLRALWSSVRDRCRRALDARGRFPRLRRGELRKLERVIETEIPSLRAQASSATEKSEAPAETAEKAE